MIDAKNSMQKSDKNQLLNLFNSGIVIDMKLLKVKALEMAIEALKKKHHAK
jgi:hypothetical protein